MDVLGFSTLVITGFVSCAEFGSYAFVHPVIRKLPTREHILFEQGLLRTFGRFMPVAMTLCPILAVSLAFSPGEAGGPHLWRWSAAALFIAAVVSTVIVNVPLNLATGKWDADHPPEQWQSSRNRWEFFQGVRSWLLLLGFVALCVGFAT